MKKILFFAAVSLFFICGCATVDRTVKQVEKSAIYGETLLKSLQKCDYLSFTANCSKELISAFPESAFKKICHDFKEKNENIETWKILDSLNRGGVFRTEVWKVGIAEKSVGDNVIIERLFYVTTAVIDGKECVIGFKFDLLF